MILKNYGICHTFLGAINGKHIGMDCPKRSVTNYHNYNDFYSIVVDVGQYESNNNSVVLKESEFGKAFEQYLFNYPAPKKNRGCRLDKYHTIL